MPTCIHCFKKFRDRQTVKRHQGKDHRDIYPETAEPEPLTPIEIRVHIIPPEVIAIVILGSFAGDMAPPESLERTDFPILKIKNARPLGYDQETHTWSEPQIVCYYNVRDRFPKELCTYFMSRTVIKSYDEYIKYHGRIIKNLRGKRRI
jgi:hypothetical protein